MFVLCCFVVVFGFGVCVFVVEVVELLKIGFVYVGLVGDYGWIYQYELGCCELVEYFGDKVKISFVENVVEGVDVEWVICNLVKDGYGLVFIIFFGYMNFIVKVVWQFFKVIFEYVIGYKCDRNFGIYLLCFYEGCYVGGFFVVKMICSYKIGYIVLFLIFEVICDINVIQLVLDKYDLQVEFKVMWVSIWFDLGKEVDVVNVLIDQGVDVVFQYIDSLVLIQVVECCGVYVVGYVLDMQYFGLKIVFILIVNDWGLYYICLVQVVMDGIWKFEDFWGGLVESMVVLLLNQEVLLVLVWEEVGRLIELICSGVFYFFIGLICDQFGKECFVVGVSVINVDLVLMNYYVEGIKVDLLK